MKASRMVGILAAFLAFYLLSPGPVIKFHELMNWQPSPTVRLLYVPLGWASDNVPGVHDAYTFYLRMWGTSN